MSESLEDSATRAYAICERAALLQNYGYSHASIADAQEARAEYSRAGMRWGAIWAASRLMTAYRYSGHLREIEREAPDLIREAVAIGHVGAMFAIEVAKVVAEAALDPFRNVVEDAVETSIRDFGEMSAWRGITGLWQSIDQFGRDDRAAVTTMRRAAEDFRVPQWEGLWWGLTFCMAAHDDPPAARELLPKVEGFLPVQGRHNYIGGWAAMSSVVIGLVRLGDFDKAASLSPLYDEMTRLKMVADSFTLVDVGAAIAATATKDWARAEYRFAEAARVGQAIGHVIGIAESKYWHAWMLSRRREPGDGARGRQLLDEAMSVFARIPGGVRRVRETGELREALPAS